MKKQLTRGTWGIRQLIRLCTVVLGILFFWLLGFVVEDIESIPGPDYYAIEKQYVAADLTDKKKQVETQIADLERDLAGKKEQQRLIGDSSQNLQRTIGQLLELHKLSIEKKAAISDSEQENLSAGLKHFLASQEEYQNLNQTIVGLTDEKSRLGDELRSIERRMAEQREPAQKKFDELWESHRLRLAAYQLAVLLPLLLVAGYFLVARRGGTYFPLLLAVGGATLLKVALVVHEYFPSRYFKYALIAALIIVVARLLIYLIRTVAFPKREWLARQYREAYERFLCPICEYPVRTGPRKYLFWTRRTVHKVLPRGDGAGAEEAYTCPSCGTAVFEACPACGKVRHALLPHCEHCGAEKQTTQS